MRHKFLLLILIMSVILHITCMDQQMNPLSSSDLDSLPIIPYSTKILTNDKINDVSEDGISFWFNNTIAQEYEMTKGTILVAQTDSGWVLRKIEKVESVSGRIKTTTSQASLIDAVKKGSWKYPPNNSSELSKPSTGENRSIQFREVFSGITIDGNYDFTPLLGVNFKIDEKKLEKLSHKSSMVTIKVLLGIIIFNSCNKFLP